MFETGRKFLCLLSVLREEESENWIEIKLFSVEIDYNLAHNIIYGGNEYAEEHGFKIHKDFEKLTQYILEVDDDKIPLIDVEFGKDGKPLVIENKEDFFK